MSWHGSEASDREKLAAVEVKVGPRSCAAGAERCCLVKLRSHPPHLARLLKPLSPRVLKPADGKFFFFGNSCTSYFSFLCLFFLSAQPQKEGPNFSHLISGGLFRLSLVFLHIWCSNLLNKVLTLIWTAAHINRSLSVIPKCYLYHWCLFGSKWCPLHSPGLSQKHPAAALAVSAVMSWWGCMLLWLSSDTGLCFLFD